MCNITLSLPLLFSTYLSNENLVTVLSLQFIHIYQNLSIILIASNVFRNQILILNDKKDILYNVYPSPKFPYYIDYIDYQSNSGSELSFSIKDEVACSEGM